MKKLLFFLLIFFGGIYAILQGNIGRNFAKNLIVETFKKAGIEAQIGQIDGTLPHKIRLRDVNLERDSFKTHLDEISFRIVLWRLLDNELGLNDLYVKRGEQELKGKLRLYFDTKRKMVRFVATSEEGTLKGTANLSPRLTARLQFTTTKLPVPGRFFANAVVTQGENQFNMRGNWRLPKLKGQFDATLLGSHLKGEITAPYSGLAFDLENGTLSATFTSENLQALRLPLFGKLKANALWKEEKLQLDATGEDLYYGPLFFKTLSLHTADHSYHLSGDGKWIHPFELESNGTFDESFAVNIDTLNGTFFNHPFELQKPSRFVWNQSLSDFELTLDDATLLAQFNRKGDESDASLKIERLPLDIFSLDGVGNLQATTHEKKGQLKGTLDGTLGEGHFEGEFDKDLLRLKGDFRDLAHLDLSLPIHFSLFPFEAKFLPHKEAKGELSFSGHVENFLDLFNLGPHRLEGYCSCKINFTNTLYRPLIDGYLFFEDGFYQNYYTGTELTDIQAEFFAEKNIVYLRSLTALDRPQTGTMTAQGNMRLLQSDLYPFTLDVAFTNLQFVEIDLVTALANGQVHIEGNQTSALAKGDVDILSSTLTIPDHIPRPLPNLQVVYVNATKPIPVATPSYQPYPLYLDLNIRTFEHISIEGRGLQSQWRGNFHLGGTFTEPAAQGALELIEGTFSFSSRDFRLTQGSLSLSGLEHEMPYLNLAGTTETGGITITAQLTGPLNNPQIKLQSTPPLPLSSIMSHLLFGQDISEISGFQALQLASSIASLAGTGPDIMESTRRSLGVDRLRIITDPTEEGGETVALQVGKYVSKGVLVTFTQGASESAPNISVEVEIKGNIVLQIQSDQSQEQGIFTLKWNLNY